MVAMGVGGSKRPARRGPAWRSGSESARSQATTRTDQAGSGSVALVPTRCGPGTIALGVPGPWTLQAVEMCACTCLKATPGPEVQRMSSAWALLNLAWCNQENASIAACQAAALESGAQPRTALSAGLLSDAYGEVYVVGCDVSEGESSTSMNALTENTAWPAHGAPYPGGTGRAWRRCVSRHVRSRPT